MQVAFSPPFTHSMYDVRDDLRRKSSDVIYVSFLPLPIDQDHQ